MRASRVRWLRHEGRPDELVAFAQHVVIGPIQNDKHFNIVSGVVRSAKSKGACASRRHPSKLRKTMGGKGYSRKPSRRRMTVPTGSVGQCGARAH